MSAGNESSMCEASHVASAERAIPSVGGDIPVIARDIQKFTPFLVTGGPSYGGFVATRVRRTV